MHSINVCRLHHSRGHMILDIILYWKARWMSVEYSIRFRLRYTSCTCPKLMQARHSSMMAVFLYSSGISQAVLLEILVGTATVSDSLSRNHILFHRLYVPWLTSKFSPISIDYRRSPQEKWSHTKGAVATCLR